MGKKMPANPGIGINQTGQTLMSLLVSLAVGSVVILAAYSMLVQAQKFLGQTTANLDVERTTRLIRIAMTAPPAKPDTPSICQQTLLYDQKSGAKVLPPIPTNDAPISIDRVYSAEGGVIAKVGSDTAGRGIASMTLVPLNNDSGAALSGENQFNADMVVMYNMGEGRQLERRISLKLATNAAGQIKDCYNGPGSSGGTSHKAAVKKFSTCPPNTGAVQVLPDGQLDCKPPEPVIVNVTITCDTPGYENRPECIVVAPPAPTPAPVADTSAPAAPPADPSAPPPPAPTPQTGTWKYFSKGYPAAPWCPGYNGFVYMQPPANMGPCTNIGAFCTTNAMGNALAGGGGVYDSWICSP